MLIVLLLAVLGLVWLSVVLLQRHQDSPADLSENQVPAQRRRDPRDSSYFTHMLGTGDQALPAAKDETPAADPAEPPQPDDPAKPVKRRRRP